MTRKISSKEIRIEINLFYVYLSELYLIEYLIKFILCVS